MHRHENSKHSQWMGWTLGLCGLLDPLCKHYTFQKSWLCQRQAMKPNPLPQATKKPSRAPRKRNTLQCIAAIEGRSPGCICGEKIKNKKLKRLLKKLQNSNYSLRHTSKPWQWQPISQTQHVHGSPCGIPVIAWLSLTLPALLSRPFCRKISFPAEAKSHPGLADTFTALNHPPARPSAQGSRALLGEAWGGRCRQAQISLADRKVINSLIKPPRADRWALCSSPDLPASLPVWGTADRAAESISRGDSDTRDTRLGHICIPEAVPLRRCLGWSSPVQDKGSENLISSSMSDKRSIPFSHQWFFFPQHYSSAGLSNKGIFFSKKANASLKTSSAKQGK